MSSCVRDQNDTQLSSLSTREEESCQDALRTRVRQHAKTKRCRRGESHGIVRRLNKLLSFSAFSKGSSVLLSFVSEKAASSRGDRYLRHDGPQGWNDEVFLDYCDACLG